MDGEPQSPTVGGPVYLGESSYRVRSDVEESVSTADRFGVLPPLRAPGHTALHVELPAVGAGELVSDEFGSFE